MTKQYYSPEVESAIAAYQKRKAASRSHTRSNFIPAKDSFNFFDTSRGRQNNRKETNARGVNPRMLKTQHVPRATFVEARQNGQDVTLRILTNFIKKLFHVRQAA